MKIPFKVFTPITNQVGSYLAEHIKVYAHTVCPVCNKKSYMLYCDIDALEYETQTRDERHHGISSCAQSDTILEGYPDFEIHGNEIYADICSSCSTIFTVQEYTRGKQGMDFKAIKEAKKFGIDVGVPCPNCKKRNVWCFFTPDHTLGGYIITVPSNTLQIIKRNVLVSATTKELKPGVDYLADICVKCGTIVSCQPQNWDS